jgi:hypothetical protein
MDENKPCVHLFNRRQYRIEGWRKLLGVQLEAANVSACLKGAEWLRGADHHWEKIPQKGKVSHSPSVNFRLKDHNGARLGLVYGAEFTSLRFAIESYSDDSLT